MLIAARGAFVGEPAELVFRATTGAQTLSPKGALLVRLSSPPCFLCTTHFHAGDEELPCFRGRRRTSRIQSAQAAELRRFLDEKTREAPHIPVILAGDFNSDAGEALSGMCFRSLCRSLLPCRHARPPPSTPHTYPHPTAHPSPLVYTPHLGVRAHLDHFFLYRCRAKSLVVLEPVIGETLWISDHAPVLAAIELETEHEAQEAEREAQDAENEAREEKRDADSVSAVSAVRG
jgi:hypothetical protein